MSRRRPCRDWSQPIPPEQRISRSEGRARTTFGYDDEDHACPWSLHRMAAKPSTNEQRCHSLTAAERLNLLPWNGTIRKTFVNETKNYKGSTLSVLADQRDVLRSIFLFLSHPWAGNVELTVPASSRHLLNDAPGENEPVAFARCGFVNFPIPHERNVNMMPFRLGDRQSLPSNLRCYFDVIEACPYVRDEIGNVAYLTIHEGWVDPGKTQRRPGLHVESPGTIGSTTSSSFREGEMVFSWGGGWQPGPDWYEGGIYMASNVTNTTRVWDALVDTTAGKKPLGGIVEHDGGCEQLRDVLGDGYLLQEGELIWMTDRTPHEALPSAELEERQFFRLVMPNISLWYADHSTPNPNVPLPDHVQVIHGNKFEGICKEG